MKGARQWLRRRRKKQNRRKFTGRSDHSLDSKGRLNIPSRFRQVLNEAYTGELVLINWNKSLKAFPLPVWEEVEEKLLEQAAGFRILTPLCAM